MTAIDVMIVAFTLLLALWGFTQGFIVGALSLLGFAIGAVIGTRIGPEVLPGGAESPYAPLFGLLGALFAGGILAMGLEGIGLALRRRVRLPALGVVDGVLGAVLIGCLGLAIAWILGAVALHTPGSTDLRRAVQRSAILQELNAALPPSGPILNALARFDPFPRIDGPAPEVPPPSPRIARDPEVRAAGDSVVRVLSTACGLGIQGSGWVADDDLVVTNAHVVAGAGDTVVQTQDGEQLGAEAVVFDATNDVAVLRVDELEEPGLDLVDDPRAGTGAATLGFPGNGPYTVAPARLGETETVLSRDAYDQGPIERPITSLRGLVRSGNSGGPVVDRDGEVLTTIFAATRGSGPAGGYGVPNAVVTSALAEADVPVDTGACAS